MVVDGKQERTNTVQHREEEGKKSRAEKNTERNTSVGQSVSLGLSDFGSNCTKKIEKKSVGKLVYLIYLRNCT